jgi:hypothetical protein
MSSGKDKRRLLSARDVAVEHLRSLVDDYADYELHDESSYERLLLAKDIIKSTWTKFSDISDGLGELGHSDIHSYRQIQDQYISLLASVEINLKSSIG